ncbi:hypothetical protein [Saccharopolyspora griseoalba]|uniref:Chemotaxis protein n=1 Tax=Saccharopolyspora griseoalba TaxID=1431848 RepID=A0ABW2LCN8_9PSEU
MMSKPTWQDLSRTTEMVSDIGTRLRAGAHGLAGSRADALRAREALLDLSAASARLARELDQLAADTARGGIEPADSHVALDQAAAAAEDMGNCTRAAARAIEDEFT